MELAGCFGFFGAFQVIEKALFAFHDLVVGERLHVVDGRIASHGCLDLQKLVLRGCFSLLAIKFIQY